MGRPARWSGRMRSTRCSVPAPSVHSIDSSRGHDPALDLLGGPQRRRHRRDAQLHVDVGALGVVDARDHVLDPVVVARDARAQDVGVVAAGHRRQRVGPAGVGLEEDVAVEARAHAGSCRGSRIRRRKASRFLSMTTTEWPSSASCMASLGPDPAAADHHDVHAGHSTTWFREGASSLGASDAGLVWARCRRPTSRSAVTPRSGRSTPTSRRSTPRPWATGSSASCSAGPTSPSS